MTQTANDRTYEQLLRAVVLDPFDRVAPLALADFCEETGRDEEAWLIRSEVPKRSGGTYDRLLRHYRFPTGPNRVSRPGKLTWGTVSDAIEAGVRCYSQDIIITQVENGFLVALALTERQLKEFGADLFRVNPIRSVQVYEANSPYDAIQRPEAFEDLPGPHWYFSWPSGRECIPSVMPEVWSRLEGYVAEVSPDPDTTLPHRCYADIKSACRALSRATVNYGRHLAGLPPLPEKGNSS